MKYLKMFEFYKKAKDIQDYISGFKIVRKSFGKIFIDDHNDGLVVEIAYKSKFAYTMFSYYSEYLPDGIGVKEANKIVEDLLKAKFSDVEINGVIFEDVRIF